VAYYVALSVKPTLSGVGRTAVTSGVACRQHNDYKLARSGTARSTSPSTETMHALSLFSVHRHFVNFNVSCFTSCYLATVVADELYFGLSVFARLFVRVSVTVRAVVVKLANGYIPRDTDINLTL